LPKRHTIGKVDPVCWKIGILLVKYRNFIIEKVNPSFLENQMFLAVTEKNIMT
jgi:hypothetical protein